MAEVSNKKALLQGKTINVLDHGYVQIVDWMGDDKRVVDAARISYGVTKEDFDSKDRTLLRYLLRCRHTSPFEQVEFTFRMSMPIFVARQMVRHRTASLNEVSGRYTEMKDEFYVPAKGRIQVQSKDNKQGSSEETLPFEDVWRVNFQEEGNIAFENYKQYVDTGMAKELARINLPLFTYTQWYFKMDLHNLMHMLGLRLDGHAQYEIRVYAQAIYDLIKEIVPNSLEAFDDYVLGSENFSRMEMEVLRRIVKTYKYGSESCVGEWVTEHLEKLGCSKREVEDFKRKLAIQ